MKIKFNDLLPNCMLLLKYRLCYNKFVKRLHIEYRFCGVEAPDLAVVGAQVGQQYLHAVALVGGEGAAVVVPEGRAYQRRRRAGDRGDIRRALADGTFKLGIIQPAMVGMKCRGRVKRQHMPARELTLHGLAAPRAATGAAGFGL